MDKRIIYSLALAIWLVYAVATLLSPAGPSLEDYHISGLQYNLLRLTVIMPLLLIWLSALYAILKTGSYLKEIRLSPESAGFSFIYYGLILGGISLVAPSFIDLYQAYHPDSYQTLRYVTILNHYLALLSVFITFYAFHKGSKALLSTQKLFYPMRSELVVYFLIFLIGMLFSWLVMNNPYRENSLDPAINPTYFLPDWLIFSTILIPYIMAWLNGIMGIAKLMFFTRSVKGIIYRQAFLYFSLGLSVIVILTVVLQLSSQLVYVLGRVGLSRFLPIVYGLIFLLVAGYMSIARGAKLLERFETPGGESDG